MKAFATVLIAAIAVLGIGVSPMSHQNFDPEYVGSSTCINGCHASDAAASEWPKMGHASALKVIDGAAPTFPPNTAPNTVTLPAGTSWSDFNYVLGGYGWKALYVTTDNKFYTAGPDGQFNVADGSTQPYHQGGWTGRSVQCSRRLDAALPSGRGSGFRV
jgi:hypothetical protein